MSPLAIINAGICACLVVLAFGALPALYLVAFNGG